MHACVIVMSTDTKPGTLSVQGANIAGQVCLVFVLSINTQVSGHSLSSSIVPANLERLYYQLNVYTKFTHMIVYGGTTCIWNNERG